MALYGSGFCIECGAPLETGHRFCWRCGAERWIAADAAPPPPGEAPAVPPHPAAPPPPPAGALPRVGTAGVNLGALPWVYAAGAVFFLIWATQELALFLSPTGRSQLSDELARQGLSGAQEPAVLALEGVLVLGFALVAAALHATAFYGLRRSRRWGWLAAVVIAGFWSLMLVGIPVLVRLVNRNVRRAYGVD